MGFRILNIENIDFFKFQTLSFGSANFDDRRKAALQAAMRRFLLLFVVFAREWVWED